MTESSSPFSPEWQAWGVIQIRCKMRNHEETPFDAERKAKEQLKQFADEIRQWLPHEAQVEFSVYCGLLSL